MKLSGRRNVKERRLLVMLTSAGRAREKGQIQCPLGREPAECFDHRQVLRARNTELSSTIVPVIIEPETCQIAESARQKLGETFPYRHID
jgi:hypothetical protein